MPPPLPRHTHDIQGASSELSASAQVRPAHPHALQRAQRTLSHSSGWPRGLQAHCKGSKLPLLWAHHQHNLTSRQTCTRRPAAASPQPVCLCLCLAPHTHTHTHIQQHSASAPHACEQQAGRACSPPLPPPTLWSVHTAPEAPHTAPHTQGGGHEAARTCSAPAPDPAHDALPAICTVLRTHTHHTRQQTAATACAGSRSWQRALRAPGVGAARVALGQGALENAPALPRRSHAMQAQCSGARLRRTHGVPCCNHGRGRGTQSR
jgi:hypothetical protein